MTSARAGTRSPADDGTIDCYLLALGGCTGTAMRKLGQFGAPEVSGNLRIHRTTADAAELREEATALLDENERAGIAAMRHAGQRDARLLARACLRLLLASRLDRTAQSLAFVTGPHGKPALNGGGAHFSLSWRDGIAAIAICRDHPVGIDVETAAEPGDADAVAAWMFSPAEAAAQAEVPAGERTASFLIAWTRKEAVCKAAGLPLDTMRGVDTREATIVLTDASGIPARFAASSHAEGELAWSLAWRLATDQSG